MHKLPCWEEFSLFLKVDKGRSQRSSALFADKSRFQMLARWFTDKDWNPPNFRSFLAMKQDEKKAVGTQNKYMSMGRLIDQYLGTSVMVTFKTKTEPIPKLKDFLTHEDVAALAEVRIPYKKYREYIQQRQNALIYFLWDTGCRISEALDLTWDKIHTNPFHVEFVQTKNGTDRDMPIGLEMHKLLLALPRDSSKVFESGRKGALGLQQINADLKRRAKATGIAKNVHCHLFRHSCASELKRRGVADSDICRLLGWKDPKMLLRYDNNQIDYLSDVASVHPMNISALSFEDKIKHVEKEIVKWFKLSEYQIFHEGDVGASISLNEMGVKNGLSRDI